MAREWISAHEASRLVEQVMDYPEAVRAICTYASEGLVTARAKKLIGVEIKSDAEIPAEFWRALIDDALTQDWTLGTFRSQIGNQHHPEGAKFCRAFGVEFRWAEIAAILPANLLGDETPNGVSENGANKEPRVNKRWRDWVAELVLYMHGTGVPPGVGSQGQEEIIKAVDAALIVRGKAGPARTTVQPVVQAVLDRLRGAEN